MDVDEHAAPPGAPSAAAEPRSDAERVSAPVTPPSPLTDGPHVDDPREIGERLHDLVEREAEAANDVEVSDSPPGHGHGAQTSGPTGDGGRGDALADLGLVAVDAEALAGSDYGVCPFCSGYGAVDPDDVIKALPAIVEAVAPFPQSPTYARCDECDGWGRVLTGARLGEPGIQPCPKCNGNGYIDRRSATPPQPPSPDGFEREQPTPAYVGPDPLRMPPPDGQPPAVGMVWSQDRYTWEYPSAV